MPANGRRYLIQRLKIKWGCLFGNQATVA